MTVEGDEGSPRLDRVLASACENLSRSRLKALILAGAVAVKGAPVRDPAYHVGAGDTITIDVPEAAAAEPEGEDIPLHIVFEDDDIIVIDKPKGLVVHPAAGHATGTLVNALIAHCGDSLSGIGGVKRPGIVHRLDKDTTGLMVVAKNDAAHASLTAQFAHHVAAPGQGVGHRVVHEQAGRRLLRPAGGDAEPDAAPGVAAGGSPHRRTPREVRYGEQAQAHRVERRLLRRRPQLI